MTLFLSLEFKENEVPREMKGLNNCFMEKTDFKLGCEVKFTWASVPKLINHIAPRMVPPFHYHH